MNIKVIGGTSSADLCLTCNSGVQVQGQRQSEAIRYCTRLDKSVPFSVVKCSKYSANDDIDYNQDYLHLRFDHVSSQLMVSLAFEEEMTISEYIKGVKRGRPGKASPNPVPDDEQGKPETTSSQSNEGNNNQ